MAIWPGCDELGLGRRPAPSGSGRRGTRPRRGGRGQAGPGRRCRGYARRRRAAGRPAAASSQERQPGADEPRRLGRCRRSPTPATGFRRWSSGTRRGCKALHARLPRRRRLAGRGRSRGVLRDDPAPGAGVGPAVARRLTTDGLRSCGAVSSEMGLTAWAAGFPAAAGAPRRAPRRRQRHPWVGTPTPKAILGTTAPPGLLDRLLAHRGYRGQVTLKAAPPGAAAPSAGDGDARRLDAGRGRAEGHVVRVVRRRPGIAERPRHAEPAEDLHGPGRDVVAPHARRLASGAPLARSSSTVTETPRRAARDPWPGSTRPGRPRPRGRLWWTASWLSSPLSAVKPRSWSRQPAFVRPDRCFVAPSPEALRGVGFEVGVAIHSQGDKGLVSAGGLQRAVRLRLRFAPSHRDVENLLAGHGRDVFPSRGRADCPTPGNSAITRPCGPGARARV